MKTLEYSLQVFCQRMQESQEKVTKAQNGVFFFSIHLSYRVCDFH